MLGNIIKSSNIELDTLSIFFIRNDLDELSALWCDLVWAAAISTLVEFFYIQNVHACHASERMSQDGEEGIVALDL